jgi:hypothetical protein
MYLQVFNSLAKLEMRPDILFQIEGKIAKLFMTTCYIFSICSSCGGGAGGGGIDPVRPSEPQRQDVLATEH